MQNRSFTHISVLILVVVTTGIVYGQVFWHDFVNIDDHIYVYENEMVTNGLTWSGIVWAFTTLHAEFWHPITWLSLMVDASIWSGRAGGYLLTNLMIHLLNIILLYYIFYHSTQKPWKSLLVAAIFALHPLHVESVAWVSERKDVLSAFFGLLAILSYVHYVQHNHRNAFVVCHISYLLALMSKPMIVTLPILLLFMDIWPFKRWQPNQLRNLWSPQFVQVLKEKVLLLGLSLMMGIITIVAQYRGQGLVDQVTFSMGARIQNAVISYTIYLYQTFFPFRLSIFYPLKVEIPLATLLASLFIVSIITVISIRKRHEHPFAIMGWLWYMVSLLPAIGLLKIGDFAHADRYMYLPMIGIGIVLVWGMPVLIGNGRHRHSILVMTSVATMILLSFLTWKQVRVWENSRSLFENALTSSGSNYFTHHALGNALAEQGNLRDAIYHFKKSVSYKPDRASLKTSLGRALFNTGQIAEAKHWLTMAVQDTPEYPNAHYIMALVLLSQENVESSVEHFHAAIVNHPQHDERTDRVDPIVREAYRKGKTLESSGRSSQAIQQYRLALDLKPDFYPALARLGKLYQLSGYYDQALSLYGINKDLSWLKQAVARGYHHWQIQLNKP